MSDRPLHSVLVKHGPHPNPANDWQALIGYSPACLACQEAKEQKR